MTRDNIRSSWSTPVSYTHLDVYKRQGLAAHHAGLVPAYRETVEECFAGGLLQVVFATETLSLGINMPRCV